MHVKYFIYREKQMKKVKNFVREHKVWGSIYLCYFTHHILQHTPQEHINHIHTQRTGPHVQYIGIGILFDFFCTTRVCGV